MWTYKAPTLTRLHDDMTRSLIEADASGLDVISTVDVQRHEVMGWADSMDWTFDLKDMWLTPSRWTMMVNQYIDSDEFRRWVEVSTGRIGVKGRGINVMRTKIVKPRGGAATGHTNKETRRWGSCMLALSYKAVPRPSLTLHSRTSYLGYIGALDLSVAWMAARYLGKELGLVPEDFSFTWMIEAIQWHNFKSMAWMLNHPDADERRLYRRVLTKGIKHLEPSEIAWIENSPAIRLTRKWLRNMMRDDADEKTYGDMSYNTYRRIRRRWHTEVLGYDRARDFEGWSFYKQGPKKGEKKEYFKAYQPLPSTPIERLDFKALGFPWGSKLGMEFDAEAAAEMDDEDDDE